MWGVFPDPPHRSRESSSRWISWESRAMGQTWKLQGPVSVRNSFSIKKQRLFQWGIPIWSLGLGRILQQAASPAGEWAGRAAWPCRGVGRDGSPRLQGCGQDKPPGPAGEWVNGQWNQTLRRPQNTSAEVSSDAQWLQSLNTKAQNSRAEKF